MRKKIAIVIEGGLVRHVYTDDPNGYDVEVIDLDTEDEELDNAHDRLGTIRQHLVDVY